MVKVSGDGVSGESGELVHTLLDDAAAEVPDSTAVRDGTGAWTYRELAELSRGVARWFREQGIEAGDRVVAQLPTRREVVAMVYGASRCGATFVPLNPAMKPFHIAAVLENSEPALVLGSGSALGPLRELASVAVHDVDQMWSEVTADADAPADADATDPTALAFLIYTSGSTGAPKAIMCPHAQVVFASRSVNSQLGFRSDDVVFCRFPLSWDVGLYKIFMCALGRSELVLASEESDLVLLKRMRETGATVVPIVPSFGSMIATLSRRETEPFPPVRLLSNTGAALPTATIDALREAFPDATVVRQFGQTECKRITIMPPDEHDERSESVGKALPGTEVRVVDAGGEPVPAGTVGEIVALGPHVMPGYWRNEEVTARTFRPDPRTGEIVLHTGDYGSLDEDGYLYFEGRRDDMFKRKGTRVSTLEIEAAAVDVAGVAEAVAIPPGENWDLVLFARAELAPHVILKELSQRLEPAKVPARCEVVSELPVTPNGKYARDKLVEMLDGSK